MIILRLILMKLIMQSIAAKVFMILLVGSLSGVLSAHAQDSRLENQLLRCSAITTIFSIASEKNTETEIKLQKMPSLFFEFYANEKKSKNTEMKPEEILGRRQQILSEIKDHYVDREALLIEEGVVCGAWAEGFLSQGENITFIPVYPKVISSQIRDDYARIASVAFKKWLALGAPMSNTK
jgi:hypothetical protein